MGPNQEPTFFFSNCKSVCRGTGLALADEPTNEYGITTKYLSDEHQSILSMFMQSVYMELFRKHLSTSAYFPLHNPFFQGWVAEVVGCFQYTNYGNYPLRNRIFPFSTVLIVSAQTPKIPFFTFAHGTQFSLSQWDLHTRTFTSKLSPFAIFKTSIYVASDNLRRYGRTGLNQTVWRNKVHNFGIWWNGFRSLA